MNTVQTVYNNPTTTPGIVSIGQYGKGGYPIFKKPTKFEGDGLALSALKKGVRSTLAKSRTLLKEKAREAMKKRRGQKTAKSKVQQALNKKLQTAVKRLTGSKTLSTNVKGIINKKVKNLGPAATRKLVAASPRGIENRVKKAIGKSSIKEPSHNDLVRQAERMIYSGANF